MAESQSKIGILFLADIVDYTAQSKKLGTDKTARFNEQFEQKVRELTKSHKGEFIKTIGDAVLIFFADPGNFLDFAGELRLLSKQRKLDMNDFFADLRIVAHYGNFSFSFINEIMADLIGPEGIKVFRIEKHAKKHEVVVTEFLHDILENSLKEKHISSIELGRETLKGFNKKATLYKLVFPETEEMVPTALLMLKMAQLEEETKTIPVFGDLYPALSMKDNFINLDIKRGQETAENYRFFPSIHLPFEEMYELKQHKRHLNKDESDELPYINVEKLYESQRRGIILGLPGSGKTTILKYFAYRDFDGNRGGHPGEEGAKRIVLFIECRNIIKYEDWLQTGTRFNIETILNYLAYCFLFKREAVENISKDHKAELETAEKLVHQAFHNGRLTVLIDALDESPGKEIKERILSIVKALLADSKTKKEDTNRVYLTSRYSEAEKYFWGKNAGDFQPMFEVRYLDMEQLRQMARYFYGEESPLYLEFDTAVWQEEIASKVGSTPLTALLVLAYFEIFKKFDTRYHMYNIIVLFILLRVWKRIKDKHFSMDMRTFFKEARSKNILNEEKNAKEIYDALTLLSFAHMDIGKVIREGDIMGIFQMFAGGVTRGCSAEEEAARWLEWMKDDHLFVSAGVDEYVFIHSTVMEYLAARYIVEKINDPTYLETHDKNPGCEKCLMQKPASFFETEILPIAVGSGIKQGARILRFISDRISRSQDETEKGRLYTLALKGLVELESFIDRQMQRKRLDLLHRELETEVAAHWREIEWVYLYLKNILLGADKTGLKTLGETFKNISRLSRPYFLERYVPVDSFLDGGSEIISIRKELLYKLINREIVEQWIRTWNKPGDGEEEGINLLTMDSIQYHPEDKNFNYYRGIIGKELIGFFGSPNFKHSESVNACAFSRDGKTILSASLDKTLKLWDVESGKEIRSFIGHTDSVNGCAFSPDGKTILSSSSDHTIKLWDVDSGKVIQSLSGHAANVFGCVFSPDGKTILSASEDKSLKLWDIGRGKEIRSFRGHKLDVLGCAFSPDGMNIVSASNDSTLKLWDVSSGKEIRSFIGHKYYVNGCCFSPDGKTILSASGDHTLKLWNIRNSKEIRSFMGHEYAVHDCAFSPDGNTIVSASDDKTLKLWNVWNGKEIHSFSGHNSFVNGCAFSPDGKTILSADDDNTLKLWNVESGREIRFFTGHKAPVTGCAFSPDAKTILSASDDKTLKLWDTESGKEIHPLSGHRDSVKDCAFSPDGTTIVSASSDNTLKLWDAGLGKEIRSFAGHMSSVHGCAFSPDGKTIISASSDKTLKLWDAGRGAEIRSFIGHWSSVLDCAFSLNGTAVLSASEDTTLKLWEAGNGKEILFFTGHDYYVNGCSFSPDAKTILSASDDNTLKLWDTENGKEIHSFSGHRDSVKDCAFSPDGKIIISASWDYTLKLWDAESGKELKSMNLPWIPYSISVSPTNERFIVITANLNGTVTMFDFSDWMGKK